MKESEYLSQISDLEKENQDLIQLKKEKIRVSRSLEKIKNERTEYLDNLIIITSNNFYNNALSKITEFKREYQVILKSIPKIKKIINNSDDIDIFDRVDSIYLILELKKIGLAIAGSSYEKPTYVNAYNVLKAMITQKKENQDLYSILLQELKTNSLDLLLVNDRKKFKNKIKKFMKNNSKDLSLPLLITMPEDWTMEELIEKRKEINKNYIKSRNLLIELKNTLYP